MDDPHNIGNIIVTNLSKEENVCQLWKSLDARIFATIQRMALNTKSDDSKLSLLLDVTTLSCYVGPCMSKYTQTKWDRVDHHTYPSGNHVVKAWTDKTSPSMTSMVS